MNRMQTSSTPVADNGANATSSKIDNSELSKIGLGGVDTIGRARDDTDLSKLSESSSKEEKAIVSGAPAIDKAGTAKPPVKKRRPRKKWKKPKDKPNRPLSAYNLFFQQERAAMVGENNKNSADADNAAAAAAEEENQNESDEGEKSKRRVHRKTHGKIGFAEMARSIGAKWKVLPDEDKEVFEKQAAKEKERYAKDLALWKEQQKLKKIQEEEAKALQNEENAARAELATQNQMMPEGMVNRGLSGAGAAQELSTMDYLRALHSRQQHQQGMDDGMNTYPNAAEASANAILHQYQGMISTHPQGPQAMPGQMNPFLFAGNQPMSIAEQLQMNAAAQRQMQLERLQVQQLLLQNHLASQHQQQSAQVTAMQQQQQQQQQQMSRQPFAPNGPSGRGFPQP
eukprot:scaffold2649_cov137-Cylindrotheca_fusiformis.AAC.9